MRPQNSQQMILEAVTCKADADFVTANDAGDCTVLLVYIQQYVAADKRSRQLAASSQSFATDTNAIGKKKAAKHTHSQPHDSKNEDIFWRPSFVRSKQNSRN